MKICISIASKDDRTVDARFARSMFWGLYDVESEMLEFIENEGFVSNHGAGIAAAHQVIKLGADAVITGNIGPNAYEILEDSDIKMYKMGSSQLDEAVKEFKEGCLGEISGAGPKHFGMGSSK